MFHHHDHAGSAASLPLLFGVIGVLMPPVQMIDVPRHVGLVDRHRRCARLFEVVNAPSGHASDQSLHVVTRGHTQHLRDASYGQTVWVRRYFGARTGFSARRRSRGTRLQWPEAASIVSPGNMTKLVENPEARSSASCHGVDAGRGHWMGAGG